MLRMRRPASRHTAKDSLKRSSSGSPFEHSLLELDGFLGQLEIRELLHGRLEVIDGRDEGTHPLDFAFVLRPEDFREDGIEHGVPGIILTDPAGSRVGRLRQRALAIFQTLRHFLLGRPLTLVFVFDKGGDGIAFALEQ